MRKATPRRNRSAHMWFSKGIAKAEANKAFDLTDDDWRRVESEYGTGLDTSERSKIAEHVDAYLLWAQFEESAVNATDVKRTIERIAKATANLSLQLHALFDTDQASVNSAPSEHSDAYADRQLNAPLEIDKADKAGAPSKHGIAEAARLMIERAPTSPVVDSVLSQVGELLDGKNVEAAAEFLRDALGSSSAHGVKIEDHLAHLGELAFACEAAVKHLDATIRDRQGLDIGDAWKQMIQELHAWARTSGKPHKVSANRERPKPMPFVRFVAALQARFPDGYARHMHSEWSLADAIYEVMHRREGLVSSCRKDNP